MERVAGEDNRVCLKLWRA